MDDGVGKTLREAREQRDLGLAEVEARLKIRIHLLQALEAETWERLPDEAYTRSFIRTYGDYLGLDGAGLAERHRHEVEPAAPVLEEADGVVGPAMGRARSLPPALTVVAAVVLVLAVGAFALSFSGDGDGPSRGTDVAGAPPGGQGGGSVAEAAVPTPATPESDLSLRLTAETEVWVCLLGASGRPLLDGKVLNSGVTAGPFRSGSFTVSLGNGGVSMTVNGQRQSIAETPSPIGYAIGADRALRELAEGERPDCT